MDQSPEDRRGQESEALIYIVDDDKMVAEVVEAVLRTRRYQVRLFDDPQVALETFLEANPKPDLLFTDYVMDRMNGLELIEKCRGTHPSLKTILYSGTIGQDIWNDSETKPDDFISKPFNPKTVLEAVRTVLAAR
jgi:DNA-binding NtrC family response regulator